MTTTKKWKSHPTDMSLTPMTTISKGKIDQPLRLVASNLTPKAKVSKSSKVNNHKATIKEVVAREMTTVALTETRKTNRGTIRSHRSMVATTASSRRRNKMIKTTILRGKALVTMTTKVIVNPKRSDTIILLGKTTNSQMRLMVRTNQVLAKTIKNVVESAKTKTLAKMAPKKTSRRAITMRKLKMVAVASHREALEMEATNEAEVVATISQRMKMVMESMRLLPLEVKAVVASQDLTRNTNTGRCGRMMEGRAVLLELEVITSSANKHPL